MHFEEFEAPDPSDKSAFAQIVMHVSPEERKAMVLIWSGVSKVASDLGLSIPQVIGAISSVLAMYNSLSVESLKELLPKENGKSISEKQAHDFMNQLKREMDDDEDKDSEFFSEN